MPSKNRCFRASEAEGRLAGSRVTSLEQVEACLVEVFFGEGGERLWLPFWKGGLEVWEMTPLWPISVTWGAKYFEDLEDLIYF